MAADTGDQKMDQQFCRILVFTEEETGTATPNEQCRSQLESHSCEDAPVIMNYQKLVDFQTDCFDPFPSPCLIPGDIEKGAMSVSKFDQENSGSIKNEISITKPLRRQNSLRTGGESIPPLMNHLLMLLKFESREKQAIERTHDAANNRWRKYKRAASFDARQIVLLFSVLSSMGTIVLIFLTLRVRQVNDGYIHVCD